jgi:hypothetical protein
MTWLVRLLAVLFPPRSVPVLGERTRVLDAGSVYRLGQRTEQAGLVTGARMRTR